MENALDHFERSFRLFSSDREMASFRAITGEEAATALIKAIQLRGYPNAKQFLPRDHRHKAAVIACALAIGTTMRPALQEFQLIFDFQKNRIDVRIPLSNFGVVGCERYAVQPVEPLAIVYTKPNRPEHDLFSDELQRLAEGEKLENIKRLVARQANARNKLLYASDSAPPSSQATLSGIEQRKQRAITLLMIAVMVLQSREHLALVKQATFAFLDVISKLPKAQTSV